MCIRDRYDRFYKMIYKCDPFVPNFNNKPTHCLVDGDHVYTLNHDPTSLEHTNTTESDETEELKLHVGTNYRVDRRGPTKHHMITHVDDILAVLGEVSGKDENEEAIFLTHQDDSLEELLWQLTDRGHKWRVVYHACNVTHISMYFNKHRIAIKCQQLVKTYIAGLIHITDVNCDNRRDEVMAHFRNHILRMRHKSYYEQQGMEILSEHRTIALAPCTR